MGAAIAEYYAKGRAARLRVFSSQFYEDEIPVDTLFRTLEDMPTQEQEALRLCRGRVLDVGAGSGCHSMELMNRGMDVMAIDISTLSVDVENKNNRQRSKACQWFCVKAGRIRTCALLMRRLP